MDKSTKKYPECSPEHHEAHLIIDELEKINKKLHTRIVKLEKSIEKLTKQRDELLGSAQRAILH